MGTDPAHNIRLEQVKLDGREPIRHAHGGEAQKPDGLRMLPMETEMNHCQQCKMPKTKASTNDAIIIDI